MESFLLAGLEMTRARVCLGSTWMSNGFVGWFARIAYGLGSVHGHQGVEDGAVIRQCKFEIVRLRTWREEGREK